MVKWITTTISTWTQPQNNQQSVPTEPDARLVEEGFPRKVSEAFQKAADELNCVIWSRVPGKACTTLIDEGYNLKPFYVHGKSCDWGPMAGFVCQLPVLNKSGTSKMAYNLQEHINSLSKLERIQENDNKQAAKSLFIPLVISEKRMKELLKSFLHDIIHSDKLIWGIAEDKNETVVVEFLMKKKTDNPNLWDIYHRNIYIKSQSGKYISYLKQDKDKFLYIADNIDNENQEKIQKYNAKIKDSMKFTDIEDIKENEMDKINEHLEIIINKKFLGAVVPQSVPKMEFLDFYPVNAIQSPYLAYTDEENLYKNAVSGDYDLFAVWPFTPNASFKMTTRLSERLSTEQKSDQSQKLFIPVETKINAVEITKSRNVFIEFIGTYQELEEQEDPEIGNINELVFLTAQTLNSLVQAVYKIAEDKGQFPNRAFHSDEGGRPGVDEIDYPIAFFMPKSLWNDLKKEESSLIQDRVIKGEILTNTAFVVEKHVEFLSLIQLLRRRFYIFLHDGWVMHLMCLAAGANTMAGYSKNDKLTEKSRKYFEDRKNEIDELDNSLEDIKSSLQELLTSIPKLDSDKDAFEAFNKVIEEFITIASKKQLPLAAERKKPISALEIQISK